MMTPIRGEIQSTEGWFSKKTCFVCTINGEKTQVSINTGLLGGLSWLFKRATKLQIEDESGKKHTVYASKKEVEAILEENQIRPSSGKIGKLFAAVINLSSAPAPVNKQGDLTASSIKLKDMIGDIQAIPQNFTKTTSIEKQRKAHEVAKSFLQEKMQAIGGSIAFVSPPAKDSPNVDEVAIKKSGEGSLNSTVFRFQYTSGVREDIQNDGNRSDDNVVVYGAASQFNGCEATGPHTVRPGGALGEYLNDFTQGPQAQLAFGRSQIELINCGGNLGYNGLCNLLDEETKDQIAHGYFIPSEGKEEKVIKQLQTNGSKIEYPCVVNKPLKGKKDVHLFLVAAPAFGMYCPPPVAAKQAEVQKARNQIQFLCALHAFRAQFQYCITLAETTQKPVVFKPAAVGLGVFGNNPAIVAKAFYEAAKEYEAKLEENKVQVLFQIFKKIEKTDERATQMANLLGLIECLP